MRPLIFSAAAERRRAAYELRREIDRQRDLFEASVILAGVSRPIGECVS